MVVINFRERFADAVDADRLSASVFSMPWPSEVSSRAISPR